MNIAVTTEGKADKKVYKRWIPFVNPLLTYVDNVYDIKSDNFSIISGGGYPYYLSVITRAIQDVNSHGKIDRLIISVDSEDNTYQEKQTEISNHITAEYCTASILIIIQHFCIETWALGNKLACPVNTTSLRLTSFKQLLNVRQQDPELLPPNSTMGLNRAKFAELYLRTMVHDKYPKRSYHKNRPNIIYPYLYFKQIQNRHNITNHISSFSDFLTAFV